MAQPFSPWNADAGWEVIGFTIALSIMHNVDDVVADLMLRRFVLNGGKMARSEGDTPVRRANAWSDPRSDRG